MNFVLFYHSLASDWNHGNAHFLRGIASELVWRGHHVEIYEPEDGWSRRGLVSEAGEGALQAFTRAYPELASRTYDPARLDLDEALAAADVVLVHEWNEPDLIRRVPQHAPAGCRLFFHDTHHRCISDPGTIGQLELPRYDGVLAFGRDIADLYLHRGWARLAWVWHEAADVRRFRPQPRHEYDGDLVWIGNWGDEERSAELHEFLIGPVAELKLRAAVYGVRYPTEARRALRAAGIEYRGWLPNFEVPATFARFRCTVHVPRRQYTDALDGVPTIRVFEALACGIPLVCAPWTDSERLFRAGVDYLVANDGRELRSHLQSVLCDRDLSSSLAQHGLQTIEARHTCAHRVDQLFEILEGLHVADGRMSRLPPRHPRASVQATAGG
jgi:spore maturation protein CgeB